MSRQRQLHQNGPQPIQFSEIKAYAELNSMALTSDDISTITQLDAIYRECANQQISERITRQQQAIK